MNGVNLLKITKEMWLEIKNGNKHIEVRKLNKDYIQSGNDIVFVDIETYEHYGNRRCIGKLYLEPQWVGEHIKHKSTVDFVNKNYIDEPYVILFTLGSD